MSDYCYTIGEIIKTRKKRTIYVYIEKFNKIQKTTIPVLSIRQKKRIQEQELIPNILVSVDHSLHEPLFTFIYDYTLKGCKSKVKKHINKQIKKLKEKLKWA